MGEAKGFTLIELLVVIAIIALLAAILFPVFATAKKAAMCDVAISNIRQMGTAAFLYLSDVDDRFPLGAYNESDGNYVLWHNLLYPYTKSEAVWYCPGSDVTPVDSSGKPTTDWGYNFEYLTTLRSDFSNANGHTGIPFSQVSDAAGTVLFAAAHSSLATSWCGNDGKFLLPPSGIDGDCLGRPDVVLLESVPIAWVDDHANRLMLSRFYQGQTPADRYFDLL